MRELEALNYNVLVRGHGDIIFKHNNPSDYQKMIDTLAGYTIPLDDILIGGGSKSKPTKALEGKFKAHGWAPEIIKIQDTHTYLTTGVSDGIDCLTHEIDHFIYTGKIGIEIEWNNKDTFFDRDLGAFGALYQRGIVDVGVIITRGATLQELVHSQKYGTSTTHWNKLVNKINLGIGGNFPLIALGIPYTTVR